MSGPFNIGEGFRTIHKLLKPGGIALHALPTYGAYYHGFYNIHSVVFRSLVAGNGYELVNLSYAHDIGRENERFLSNFRSRLDDITDNEVRLQNVKFFWYYFSSILKNSERPISLVLAAVRKTKDAPFVFPQQINKYPMPWGGVSAPMDIGSFKCPPSGGVREHPRWLRLVTGSSTRHEDS